MIASYISIDGNSIFDTAFYLIAGIQLLFAALIVVMPDREIEPDIRLMIANARINELNSEIIDAENISREVDVLNTQNQILQYCFQEISAEFSYPETKIQDHRSSFKACENLIEQLLANLLSYKAEVFQLTPETRWSMALYVPDGNELVPFWRRNHPNIEVSNRTWPPGQGHVGACYQSNRPVFSDDAAKEGNMLPNGSRRRAYDATQFKSVIALPVRLGGPVGVENEGYLPLGVLVLTTNEPGSFDESHQNFLECFATSIAILIWLIDSTETRI